MQCYRMFIYHRKLLAVCWMLCCGPKQTKRAVMGAVDKGQTSIGGGGYRKCLASIIECPFIETCHFVRHQRYSPLQN